MLAEKQRAYSQIDENTRGNIKRGLISVLETPDANAAKVAAMVMAKVAAIEIGQQNRWPGLIQKLSDNVTTPGKAQGTIKASLDAIGYMCEDVDPSSVSQDGVNRILTAIVDGMKQTKTVNGQAVAVPNEIVLSGCRAMLNALDFVANNFENKVRLRHRKRSGSGACLRPRGGSVVSAEGREGLGTARPCPACRCCAVVRPAL